MVWSWAIPGISKKKDKEKVLSYRARKKKALQEYWARPRVVKRPPNFIRSNRSLKLAQRTPINREVYYMLQEFVLNDHIEFKFVLFMSYHFGLHISDIVYFKKTSLKELIKKNRTVLISETTGSIKELWLTPESRKELLDIKLDMLIKKRMYKIKKESEYILRDIKGKPFKPMDVAEIVNMRLLEIVDYLDFEEDYCWSISIIRLSNLTTVMANNDYFARFSCQDRWFYDEEDFESVIEFDVNYTVSYYYERTLAENPYTHTDGLYLDKEYVLDNPCLHTPTSNGEHNRISLISLENRIKDIEDIEDVEDLERFCRERYEYNYRKLQGDIKFLEDGAWSIKIAEYLPYHIPLEIRG